MGCSKNREKLSGNWKGIFFAFYSFSSLTSTVVPRQGCNGVQLDYDPGDLERVCHNE
jgi:hypothetical protein